MAEDDDDVPALPAETFAALQEFYTEQDKRKEIFDKLEADNKLKENVLFDENWIQDYYDWLEDSDNYWPSDDSEFSDDESFAGYFNSRQSESTSDASPNITTPQIEASANTKPCSTPKELTKSQRKKKRLREKRRLLQQKNEGDECCKKFNRYTDFAENPEQQYLAKDPLLCPEGRRDSVNRHRHLALMIYREDGVPIDKTFASAIRKRLRDLILEAVKARVESTKLNFATSVFVSMGFFILTPEREETRNWILAQDFGVICGVPVHIRPVDKSKASIWVPRANPRSNINQNTGSSVHSDVATKGEASAKRSNQPTASSAVTAAIRGGVSAHAEYPTPSTSAATAAAGSHMGKPTGVKPVPAAKAGKNKPKGGKGQPVRKPAGGPVPPEGRVATALDNSAAGHSSCSSGIVAGSLDPSWQVVGRRGAHKNGKPADKTRVQREDKRKPNKRQRALAREQRLQAAASSSYKPTATPPGPATAGTSELPTGTGGQKGNRPGTARPTAKMYTNAQSARGNQSRAKRSAERPAKRDREAARREHQVEEISPQGVAKRRCLGSPFQASTSYASVVKTEIGAAITTAKGSLSRDAADAVVLSLHRGLVREANMRAAHVPWGPVFRGKPTWEDGFLKLWCADQRTVDWLKGLVCGITAPSGESLTVKGFSELPRRLRCGILIPNDLGQWKRASDIGKVLVLQNKWAGVNNWLLHSAKPQKDGWFVIVSVPEGAVPIIIENDRRLACGLGSVYLKFQGPKGKFYINPPGDDDDEEELSEEEDQAPSTCGAASVAQDPPCQREEGASNSPRPGPGPREGGDLPDNLSGGPDPSGDEEEPAILMSDLCLEDEEELPSDGEQPSRP